jgi:hypothetical protein
MRTIKSFGLLLLLLAVTESYSQGIFSKRNIVNQYSTVGIGGGSSHYWGDLSSFRTPWLGLVTTPRWNGTINYTRFLSANVAARFSFSYIRIMGDDYAYSQWDVKKFAGQFMRNIHFRNDIKEFTITGIYNFTSQNGRGPKNRTAMFPYIFAGIGFYGHNPMAKAAAINPTTGDPILKDNGKVDLKGWTALAPLKTSDQIAPYGAIQLVAPVGFGIRKRLNDQWDIAAEAGLRITPFDYLDDVGESLYPAVTDRLTFTNRSFENVEARRGKDRIEDFQSVAQDVFGLVAGPGVTPWGNTLVGQGQQIQIRGTKAWDYYATVQITLNYILSNKIKCPPIK